VELNVLDVKGVRSAALEVPESVFGAAFNEPLVHQAVVAFQAGARAGTKAQKNRSAVRGGGRKPFRQKGTGRARAGTIRSPLWRGGGKVFPAVPKDHSQKINRRMYRAAIRSILSELVRQERLVVLEGLELDVAKTRELTARLDALGGRDVLIVADNPQDEIFLAARNLPRVDVRARDEIDPVALIAHERVLITADAVRAIAEWLE
jgi:large subunit ribosomal protein L4